MNLMWLVLKLSFQVLVVLSEGICWLVLGCAQLVVLTIEAVHARRRLTDGGLRCPEGHIVPTEGFWECECHFRWRGSVWQCPNPACHAVTPFVFCPLCRLAVRNPYLLEGIHVPPTA